MILRKLLGSAGYRMDAHELHHELREHPHPFVVDVRRPDEFAGGHVPGARSIPLAELADHLDEVPRDREIVCVCRSGSRSASGVRMLRKHGYTARNLRGGMIAWGRAGLPVQIGSGSTGPRRKRPVDTIRGDRHRRR